LWASPPQRPTLWVVYWETSHGLVTLSVVFQLGFPRLCLGAGDDVTEDHAAAVADEIDEAFGHYTTWCHTVSTRHVGGPRTTSPFCTMSSKSISGTALGPILRIKPASWWHACTTRLYESMTFCFFSGAMIDSLSFEKRGSSSGHL
jgi:hypothetical protein